MLNSRYYFNFFIRVLFITLCVVCIRVHANDCPSEPCATNLPKLGATDELTINIYYNNGDCLLNIIAVVCGVSECFNGSIKWGFKMGASTKKNDDGTLDCGNNECYINMIDACASVLQPEKFNTCDDDANYNDEVMQCAENGNQEDLLVQNGEDARQKNIPECKLPTLTFNDVFDLCAPTDSSENLKKYICDNIYNNLHEACKESGTN